MCIDETAGSKKRVGVHQDISLPFLQSTTKIMDVPAVYILYVLILYSRVPTSLLAIKMIK